MVTLHNTRFVRLESTSMLLNFKYLLLVCILYATLTDCSEKLINYIVTQRPAVTFLNHSYATYANVTSRRHGRGSPIYYVDIHYKSVASFDNTVKLCSFIETEPMKLRKYDETVRENLHFYFYEFLSNEYRRGFVEMHFNLCELVHHDNFFGTAMNQGKLAQPCPYPPGDYHLYNMSIPSAVIPPGFPFRKGRIYMNMTHGQDYIGCGHIDMELKEKLIKSAGHQNKKSVLHNFSED